MYNQNEKASTESYYGSKSWSKFVYVLTFVEVLLRFILAADSLERVFNNGLLSRWLNDALWCFFIDYSFFF